VIISSADISAIALAAPVLPARPQFAQQRFTGFTAEGVQSLLMNLGAGW
jgi:hypothetical protein